MSDDDTSDAVLGSDEVRQALDLARDQPARDDALMELNALRQHLLDPARAAAVLDASEAVVRAIVEDPAPRPLVQAHMVILFAQLLQIESQRDRVDALFLAWLRHPASYGSDRQTPPAFQRTEFVQRLADLLGWGSVDVTRDADALGRFLAWVNSWALKSKYRVRRTLDAMRRNFPAPELWKTVRF